MLKKLSITIVSIGILAVLGYLLIASLGKPIGSDLSVIGQGRPAIVLAYENYSPTGGDALTRLRNIKSDYEAQLDFVVADIGTPPGSQFANRHGLVDGVAVFLNQQGQAQRVSVIPVVESELRELLDSELAIAIQ